MWADISIFLRVYFSSIFTRPQLVFFRFCVYQFILSAEKHMKTSLSPEKEEKFESFVMVFYSLATFHGNCRLVLILMGHSEHRIRVEKKFL